MKRLHVHVSVENLADSIRFYSGMFASEPTVVKSDYAKWQLEDPRVNFAIFQRGAATGLNHLGIQVESAEELSEMHCRLGGLEAELEQEENTACCYARSDKYWVNDPSGIAWETFHTLDSIPVFGEPNKTAATAGAAQDVCCAPAPKKVIAVQSSCCAPAAAGAATQAKTGCC